MTIYLTTPQLWRRGGTALAAILVLGSLAGCSHTGDDTAAYPANARTSQTVRPATTSPKTASPQDRHSPPTPWVTSPAEAFTAGPVGGWWRPGTTGGWHIQYTGTVNPNLKVAVYDLDGESTSAQLVAKLHAAGKRAICYVDVGAVEKYRPDAALFPKSVIGATMEGWPDERWLDIRRYDLFMPILAKRFDVCKAKGFDAIDPDNMAGYTNRTGFPLTAADQLRFNRAIAALAHQRGLAVGLKNDVEQVATLAPDFDFAVNEECIQYHECAAYKAFTSAKKPVYSIEYEGNPTKICAAAKSYGLMTVIKNLDLDASGRAC